MRQISGADRGRFLQIAGGPARECGAIPDILDRCGVLDREAVRKGKDLWVRIVALLTRRIERGNQVREDDIVYGYGYWKKTANFPLPAIIPLFQYSNIPVEL